KHFDAQERYVFILWVLSSWIPVLNITIVGILGFTLLFLPGFSILTWGEFCGEVSWAAFFLIGTMMSMGNALTQSGVSDWLVGTVFPSSMAMPIPIILLVFSLIFFVLLLPIPLGPVLISMLGGPLAALAISWGISPALLILALAICASCCFILPLDTVPLLTYVKGYYKMQEMPRASLPIQLSIAVCIALWVPVALGILGLAG
ncbi:MAG: anion permease, partial [Eubacterium sp.]